jgi:peptidoglycan/xylan/chitin deacetylase (PgdA/CDA1 family)
MWPEGAQSAVALTFDFDAESAWIAADPANAQRPGVLSQGTYGAKVGVPLILELLARQEVAATFFVPGVVAESHDERVTQIVAAGHELGVHGYTHTAPTQLDAAAEAVELRRALGVLRGFTSDIVGYRSPAWELTSATLGLLESLGLEYSSNLMDDIRPYVHPGTRIVELPVQWLLDDAPYFWFSNRDWTRAIAPVSAVEETWLGEFEGIHRLGGATIVTMHPQVIGRPGRLAFLERFIAKLRATPGVWIATCAEIAAASR